MIEFVKRALFERLLTEADRAFLRRLEQAAEREIEAKHVTSDRALFDYFEENPAGSKIEIAKGVVATLLSGKAKFLNCEECEFLTFGNQYEPESGIATPVSFTFDVAFQVVSGYVYEVVSSKIYSATDGAIQIPAGTLHQLWAPKGATTIVQAEVTE